MGSSCCRISDTHSTDLINNPKDIPVFMPNLNNVKVIDVYDGDTITVAATVDKKLYKFKIRLYGIDSPEIKTKNKREKEEAIKSRDFLRKKILHKKVHIKEPFYEKYGRICGTVYLNNVNICNQMINKHLAVEYFGGTKAKPQEKGKSKR